MSFKNIGRRLAIMMQAAVMMLGVSSAAITGVALSPAPAMGAAVCSIALTDPINQGAACSQGGSQKTTLFGKGGIFTVIANTLVFLVGAVSVIYIIIGGVRYVTSGGDSKAVTAAKDTIMYAVIGVIVAVISFALVQFVVNALKTAA